MQKYIKITRKLQFYTKNSTSLFHITASDADKKTTPNGKTQKTFSKYQTTNK